MALTRGERETILRFDDEKRVLHVWTASPAVMRKWAKRGIPLQVTSRDRLGKPHGWGAVVPLACLRPLRALGADGQVRRIARQVPNRTVGRDSSEPTAPG